MGVGGVLTRGRRWGRFYLLSSILPKTEYYGKYRGYTEWENGVDVEVGPN